MSLCILCPAGTLASRYADQAALDVIVNEHTKERLMKSDALSMEVPSQLLFNLCSDCSSAYVL